MIDHLSSYATDYAATKKFYDAVLPTLGFERTTEMVAEWDAEFPTRRMCAYGTSKKPVFWIMEVKEPATPRHVAFQARSHADVEAFHKAALAVGARNNGAPGPRPVYHPGYYGAFVLDPDGNNIEAVIHAHQG